MCTHLFLPLKVGIAEHLDRIKVNVVGKGCGVRQPMNGVAVGRLGLILK